MIMYIEVRNGYCADKVCMVEHICLHSGYYVNRPCWLPTVPLPKSNFFNARDNLITQVDMHQLMYQRSSRQAKLLHSSNSAKVTHQNMNYVGSTLKYN